MKIAHELYEVCYPALALFLAMAYICEDMWEKDKNVSRKEAKIVVCLCLFNVSIANQIMVIINIGDYNILDAR